jgi:parallel beta-helix repeat protein
MNFQKDMIQCKINRRFLCVIRALILLVLLLPSFNLRAAVGQASGMIRRVPADYPTIQAGINAAAFGDTVLVDSGTYYENVVINKTLSLIGQNKAATIVDGNGIGKVIIVAASNVNLSGFTIRRSGQQLRDSGVFLDFRSVNSRITDNIVIASYHGIFLEYSTGNVISFNNVSGNTGRGINLASSTGNIISTNIVSQNEQDNGIELFDSTDNLIRGNTLSRNGWGGIYLGQSSNNIIKENVVSNNSETGVYLDGSSNNILYRNNLFNNGLGALGQQFTADSSNAWDNGVEGNYWSDYLGVDLNGDGIGDTDTLPHLQVDSNPLIDPWSLLRVFYVDGKPVTVTSNSTIARFSFFGPQAELDFNATGALGTLSFCNVTIPRELLSASPPKIWAITVDGVYYSHTIAENLTHASLYFTFSHSAHQVKIQVVELPNIPPIADFTYSPTNPTIYDTVNFTDSSTDDDGTVAVWKWGFGDGTNSTLQHPRHKYAVAGVYTVTLKVADDRGESTLTSKAVSVRKIGTSVMIDAPSEVNRGQLFTVVVSLRDESQNPLSDATIWVYMLREKWSIISHDETNASGIASVEYGTELLPGTYLFRAVFNGTQIFAESSSTFQVVIKGSDGAPPPSTSQLDELLLRIGMICVIVGVAIALIIPWRRRRDSYSLKDVKKGKL